MTQPFAAPTCGSDHCITCGDDGVPMTVCEVDERDGLAVCVDPDGVRSPVEIALVPPVAVGDQLLVHAGVAIVALGTEEAVA